MRDQTRDIPIIFSAPMVRALLDGRKTQTRRLVSSPLAKVRPGDRLWVRESGCRSKGLFEDWGDLFRHDVPTTPTTGHYWIEKRLGPGASYNVAGCSRQAHLCGPHAKACPSIHMPRWASRLTLVVEEVRVQRLLDINEEDAIAEGIDFYRLAGAQGWVDYGDKPGDMARRYFSDPRVSFSTLWDSLHSGKPGENWDANPTVVALTFRVNRANIDALTLEATHG